MMTRLGKKLKWIHKLRGEDVPSAIDELKSLEQYDARTVAVYKERKLRELVDFVSRECAFYRNIARRTTPACGNGSAYEILRDLPLMDKGTIKNNQSALVSPRKRTSLRSTSGTTGSPFVFLKDRHASAYMDAMMYCVYEWHGIRPTTRQARIWGSAIGIKGKTAQKGKDCLLGRKRLSAFEINNTNCRRYFHQLLRHKPKYFYCYPNAMYHFVLSLEKQGLDGREIGTTHAICTGEILYTHQKEKIEQVIGCKVINEYGTTENGIIAFECESGSMHIVPTVHIDILNPDKDGFGEIAVTELNSHFAPFIKYKIGDIGRVLMQKCKCNKSMEMVELGSGRSNDIIIKPEGGLSYSSVLAYILKDYSLHFRVRQDKIDLISVYIVPKKNNERYDGEIIEKLKKYISNKIQFNVIYVDRIPFEKSGKIRYFISNIN